MSSDALHPLPPELVRSLKASAPSQSALEAETDRQLLRLRASREARRRDAQDLFEPFPIRSLEEELALPPTSVRWTIDQLHAVGHNTTITAAYKVGKSTLMTTLGKCLADAEPFLGRHDVRPLEGRVGYVNFELTEEDFRDYFRAVGVRNADRLIPLHARGNTLDVMDDAAFEWLSGELKRHEIEVLILDPFSGAYNGEENSNSEVAAWTKRIDLLKTNAGVVDLFVPVHMGRGGEERARGATKLDDWADARWVYVRDDRNDRYLRGTVRGVGDIEERQTTLSSDGRVIYSGHIGGRSKARHRNLRQELLDHIAANPGCSSRDIEARVGGNATEKRVALKALVSTNEVVVLDGPRNAKLHYPLGHDTSGLT